MPDIIFKDAVVADDWQWLRLPESTEPVRKSAGKVVLFKLTGEAAATPELVASVDIPSGKVLLPLSVWILRKDALTPRLAAGEIGVWLDSFEEVDELLSSVDDLNRLPVIGIHFPRFIDGRGYTLARLLRTRHGYRNQLRALGDVLRDQLFFMKRCGFDAYALRADRNMHDALASLKDFSAPYQTAPDGLPPVFHRRAQQV